MQPHSIASFMDYDEFASTARSHAGRCVILARHGQRPSIPPNDPTYGRTLPLTQQGEAMARTAGRALRAAATPSDWTFGASPLRRTLLTAQYVAEEIGAAPASVSECAQVGIPGLWIDDLSLVYQYQRSMGIRQYHDQQARWGTIPGFAPNQDSATRVLQWLSNPSASFHTRLAFYATHDCHLADLLNALSVANIDAQHWVGFLQGCALFQQPDTSWTAAYIVPQKNNYLNAFFQ